MKLFSSIIFIVCILIASFRLSNAQEFYAESWKKGITQIQEKTFVIKLNKKKPAYETILRDFKGEYRYKLSVRAGTNSYDSKIIEWWLELFDLKDKSKTNLLKSSNDNNQDFFTAVDKPNWLYPASIEEVKEGIIPIDKKRVIKIESFYFVIKVNDYAFLKQENRTLKSISIEIQLINDRVVRNNKRT